MTDLRVELLSACQDMFAADLSPGTSGNLSVRDADGFWITPSGVPYDRLTADMMVHMDMQGTPRGDLKPSSEWRFHLDIYHHRADARGICHTHSVHAAGLACNGMGIPAFHYMVAAAGGRDIRCAPYRTFATQALSDVAVEALTDRKACLLSNHGVIALGDSVGKALKLAQEVETLARQFAAALQFGQPTILSNDEMDRVIEKFRTYGQQKTQ